MYWIHRIGRGAKNQREIHFNSLWYLLKNRHCLTSGWQNFVGNANIVSAVERGDSEGVKKFMKDTGLLEQQSRSLTNFSKFKIGDIVVVLPIPDYEKNFVVVKIKSAAKSILSLPPQMQEAFDTNIATISFNPTIGFVYPDGSPVDAGFFREVEILKTLPLSSRSQEFKKLCDNVMSTNAPLTDYNNAMYSLTEFYSRIARP